MEKFYNTKLLKVYNLDHLNMFFLMINFIRKFLKTK